MIERLRKNVEAGWKKLKWFSSLLSQRLRLETVVIRRMGKVRALEEERAEYFREIGKMLYDFRTRDVGDVYQDPTIRELLRQVENVDRQIEEILEEVSKLSEVESS